MSLDGHVDESTNEGIGFANRGKLQGIKSKLCQTLGAYFTIYPKYFAHIVCSRCNFNHLLFEIYKKKKFRVDIRTNSTHLEPDGDTSNGSFIFMYHLNNIYL